MSTERIALFIFGVCLISSLYFMTNKMTYFDYKVDEQTWVYFSKIQQNRGTILDTDVGPPLPLWINGLALKITENDMSPRFASLSIFLITLVITYRLFRKLNLGRTRKLLIISALLINPYFILYSRTAMTDIHYFSFLWLSLLSLYIYLEKKEKKYLAYSGLFFSLSSLTKHLSIVLYPLFITSILILQQKGRLEKKDTTTFLKYSILGYLFLGTVDLLGYIHSGEIYSFGSRLATIANIIPFIEFTSITTRGELILDPQSLFMRAIKYTIAIAIYTAPFAFLFIRLNNRKLTLKITSTQRCILLIILGAVTISLFIGEGYIRQLIVIYPVIYLFAIKNADKKNIIHSFVIFIIYCLIIDFYAFGIFDTKIFGSSKDFLENTDNTKQQLFKYINNNTDRNDIVLVSADQAIINAKDSILTSESATDPPENSKYIIYNPDWIEDKKEKENIENTLKRHHTLEKTFEYKNSEKYYVYKINPARWNKSTKIRPVRPALLLKDII